MTVPKFEISNMHNDPSSPRLWWAEVKFNFDEKIDEYEVTHWLTIRVRVTADEFVTVEQLREALFQKAVAQLSLATQAVEGKSARVLLAEAKKDAHDQERLANIPTFGTP